MECLEYRQRCGAEPGYTGAGFRQHEAECANCRAFAEEMRALDEKILAALRIDLPLATGQAAPAVETGSRSWLRSGWMSLAASLIVGLGISAGVWLSLPQPALAEAVMDHTTHERRAWKETDVPIAVDALRAVLENRDLAMSEDVGLISYARICRIRGNDVPHLMIQGQEGPVMLLLMPDEQIEEQIEVTANGLRGLIIPAGSGSIALVGMEGEPIGPLSRQVSQSVEWSF